MILVLARATKGQTFLIMWRYLNLVSLLVRNQRIISQQIEYSPVVTKIYVISAILSY
jgi:hypothetical protein